MPKINEYRTVKAQVLSFNAMGLDTQFSVQPRTYAPLVVVRCGDKNYRFSHPDWNVVSRQLAHVYFYFKTRLTQPSRNLD